MAIDGVFGTEGVLTCCVSIEPDAPFPILTKMSNCGNSFATLGDRHVGGLVQGRCVTPF